MKEKLIYCYSGCEILIVDKSPKNTLLISDLIRKFGIKRKVTSAYHSQINRLVKRGHQSIKKILIKLTDRKIQY